MTRGPYGGPWKRIRRHILERDRYTCQIQYPKCRGKADCVDHIISPAKGGSWYAPSNLRAACTTCNSIRANLERNTPPPSRNWWPA
jgi:5-methylcytosine-specific restriction enzyme A